MPVIRALCGSGFALSFVSGGFDVIFVLYCYSAVKDGGLALPVSHIETLNVTMLTHSN